MPASSHALSSMDKCAHFPAAWSPSGYTSACRAGDCGRKPRRLQPNQYL